MSGVDSSPQTMRPDYQGGSIANLMSSIAAARGYRSSMYPVLSLDGADNLHSYTNIVLLVIDGLGYNYVVNKGEGGVLQRHLKGRMTSVFPSTTATAIPTFLTGNPPQQHGLIGWVIYLAEVDGVEFVNDLLEHVGIDDFQYGVAEVFCHLRFIADQ